MLDKIMEKLTAEEREFLEHRIWVDELTGLRNRKAFETDVPRELARSERLGYDVTLLMMDVDNFKQYNDNHGHLEGDRILRELGEIMKAKTKGYDTLYRYGGEEMAVLLPNTTMEQGYNIAERLRNAISETVGVTVSIGISNYRGTAWNLYDFISNSDKALYQAKNSGRNRVKIYEVE